MKYIPSEIVLEALDEDVSKLDYQEQSSIDLKFYAYLEGKTLTDELYIGMLCFIRPLLKTMCIEHRVEDEKVIMVKVLH